MTTAAHSFIPMADSTSVSNNSRMVLNAGCAHHDTFPAGLRVLVVDDDPVCLFILNGILRKCQYQVTACGRAAQALSMLRENRDNFDVIISDVHMPDMDGFKLLELVGLEMDLPVIMMSADGETSTVMKGIKHGACDYLLKPIRIEELRNIWQHVLRKKWRSSKQHSSHADDRGKQQVAEDGDHNDSSNGGYDGTWKQGKRLKDLKEDEKDLKEDEEDGDMDSDDPSASKKPRVVWSVELHQQFVNAVNQLGIDKAVPKRILELMNVSGLTRENVASHLQKYRLCMKKLSSGVTSQSAAINPSFSVSSNTNFVPVNAAGLVGLGEMRLLTGPNELTSRAVLLPTLQAGALGRLGHASGSTLRPPFLPSCSHFVQKNQGLQVGPGEPNLTPMSTVVASPGVRPDNVPHGLSPMQGQQLEAAGNLVGLEQLAGASNNVPQISQDIILMQALQQQQGAGKAGLALPLVSTDAGVWAASFSSFNGADGMSNGILGQYGGAPRLETVPVSVACGAGESRLGPLQRKIDAESRGLYGLLGNTADRAQPGLSTDAGVWGASMSHLNASCGIAGQTDDFLGTEVPTMGGASPGSALPGPLHRTVNIENRVRQTSADSVLSSGTTDILFSRLRGMEGTLFPPINEGLPHSLGPRFSLLPGLRQGHHMGHITQGALQGSDSSREYEQAGSRVLQPPSYGPGLNYSGGPGQGQDELRGLKQQQEGLGLMGMEPGAADGQVFSNMYVK